MSNEIRVQLQATLSGTYTLERELGGGGMSRVFVAEELRLKRKVVVKVLSPELAQGISVERFEREIQTAAALQQANIVPVLSAGESNGLPFYTMPFVEGESLRARLARGPLPVTEAVGVLRDVSKALAYAHARGVVHRDIKPDNVLLSGGTAVVTDFGIAKAISAARTSSGNATLTQIGTSIGTPAYMSPEQAAGDPEIDHRADIYSLGTMAYELLSGQAVFAGRTPQRMLAAHMAETPKSIADLRPDLPPALVELVMSCLAKDPGSRPQSAADVARVLETVTSGSGGLPSMPPVLIGGPGMFRKALAMYAAAFLVVAIVAKAAIVGIGLPDWVFPGSLIVMALGLPVVLWTGYVQRVARRAITLTPTFTPGGSPSVAQGTMATLALRAAPRMSWYRTARGGMYALGGFVVLIAAFMAMRAFGIGPFGSLIASGAIKARDRVIIADFAVSSGDSALGRVVADAIRAGLGDSRVMNLVTPAEIGAALQRMQQPPSARVTLTLARQIAMREGVKAIVDGDVTIVGTSYIVATRLVTADSGRELASFRGTASSSDAIITVADALSRKLRAKAGESLKGVQATPTLAYASTSSLEALRKYSEAVRANDSDRDYMRAVRLLREAVGLDSNFAEAWRKLAVAISNSRQFAPSASDSAITRAFQLRDRMTERERDAVLAYYYQGPGYDRGKAISTYERMVARGDSFVALNNMGTLYNARREYARAESVYRAAIAIQPGNQSTIRNLVGTMRRAGNFTAVDSLLADALKRFPTASSFTQAAITERLIPTGRLDEASRALDSARKKGDPRAPSWAATELSHLAVERGHLREAGQFRHEAFGIDSAAGRGAPPLIRALSDLGDVLGAHAAPDAALKQVETALAASKIEEWPIADRPYLPLATVLARSGRVAEAKALLARQDAAARDTAFRRSQTPDVQYAQAAVATAEGNWRQAADLLRKSDRLPDGPSNSCAHCLSMDLIDLFATANLPDSALAVYTAYRKSPTGARPLEGPDLYLGASRYEALAKIYDAKGDTENAVKHYRAFIDLWKTADPELQPRVVAARQRLQQLTPVEKRRP